MNDFSLESMNAQRTEALMSKWGGRIRDVEAVKRSQGSSFSDDQAARLALLLESSDQAYQRAARMRGIRNLDEATQVTDVAAGIKRHTFDVITGVYPNLIAEELCSIQPILQKQAQIFFLKYVRGSARGKLSKGGVLFGQFETAGYENRNYTAEDIEEEAHEDFASGATKADFSLESVPVIPKSVTITIDSDSITDDGAGAFSSAKYTGTIDYATGKVEITAKTALTAAATVTASYSYDLSYAPAQAPEIELQIKDSFITARPRKLRALYAMDAAYDIQMAQGIDISESLLVASANELKHETDGDIIMDIWNKTVKTALFTDNYNGSTAGISRRDFCMTFIDTIHAACSSIYQDTKRVRGNWIVCGKKAQDLLTVVGAPRFIGSGVQSAGPYFAGTIDNQIRVFFDPFLGENDFLVGYKGDSLIDAGYIYAPYLMFYATDLVMLDDFMGRRGFATSYGKRMIEPNLYRKGTIASA